VEFIYDILLNFQRDYCDFFEWQQTDKVLNIKRIPLYKISDKDYLILKYNDVSIQENIFSKKHKIFLVTNGLEVMGVELNKNNKVTRRSSLLLEEASDILEYLPQIKTIAVKYNKNIPRKVNYEGRKFREKSKYIEEFLVDSKEKQDIYALKYLYFEIYDKEEDCLDKIYQALIDLKKNNQDLLYKSIKSIKIN